MDVYKALVVEDEILIAENMRTVLEENGWIVTALCSSRQETLDSLREELPDIVLMDIVLQNGEDGIELTKTIRDLYSIPVVFLTAHSDQKTMDMAKMAGPHAFMVKPFRTRELLITMELAIAKSQMEKNTREAEEKFRIFADFTRDWETWQGVNGGLMYVSPACKRITGYSPREFMEDYKLFEKILHPDDAPKIKEHFLLELKEGIDNYEFRIITKDGEERWISHNCQIVYDKNGVFQGRRASNRDVTVRRRIEEQLSRREEQLRSQSEHLEEVNSALRVLLRQREKDREDMEESILLNVQELILPYLNRLKSSQLSQETASILNLIETNLKEIVSPFLKKLSSHFFGLSPMELKVAFLVKAGKRTKEIADLLSLSENTIRTHRNKVREKLGLHNRKVNLRSYLQSLKG